MAIFSKKTLLMAAPSQISQIAESIRWEFELDDYEVHVDSLLSGGYDISITKGNVFKAVLGMRTALKITLTPLNGSVLFTAGVGIFGQHVVPTVITMFFFWPVIMTQIWGLIQQSSLDDRALAIAQRVITGSAVSYGNAPVQMFCPYCGQKIEPSATFCSKCGAKI